MTVRIAKHENRKNFSDDDVNPDDDEHAAMLASGKAGLRPPMR